MARLISPKETGRIRDSSGTRRFGIQPNPPMLSSMYVTIAAAINKQNISSNYILSIHSSSSHKMDFHYASWCGSDSLLSYSGSIKFTPWSDTSNPD
jgi:hypothetical protein